MTAILTARYQFIVSRIRNYRLPWEVGTVATAWISYAWIMLLVLLLSTQVACAAIQNGGAPAYTQPLPGMASPVHMGAVIERITSITNGTFQGGRILYNQTSRVVVYAWPHLQGWAFICLNGQTSSLCNAIRQAGTQGTYVNTRDFALLIDKATELGYRWITPDQLVKLVPSLATSALQSAAATAASTLPNIIVIPAGVFAPLPGAPVSSIQ